MFYSTSKPLCSKPNGHVELCLEGSGLKFDGFRTRVQQFGVSGWARAGFRLQRFRVRGFDVEGLGLKFQS